MPRSSPAGQTGAAAGQALAARVRRAVADMNRHGVRFAAFIADSLFSSDGIIPEPAGLLRPVIETVHEGVVPVYKSPLPM